MKKLILLSLLVFVNVSEAFELYAKPAPPFRRGDWDSQGEEQAFQYEPDYKFAYSCQLQVTDQLYRKGKRCAKCKVEDYQYYAVAEVELNNNHLDFYGKNLKWYGKKIYDRDTIVDTKDAVPFSTKGAHLNLAVMPGDSPQLDKYIFTVGITQNFKGVELFNSNTLTRTREEAEEYEFEVQTEIQISRDSEEFKVPVLNLRAVCEKRK